MQDTNPTTVHPTEVSAAEAPAPSPPARDHLPPEWGDYDHVEPVAEGGMGMVYKARNRRLNRVEAVKVVRAGQFAGERELERFRFEAEAAAMLDHPNLVPVYGVGEVAGAPYFAMKWIDGGELKKATALRADPKAVARVAAKIARAVHHAHRQGILHRDLKPANVLLDRAGEPHVTDFGLARRTDAVDGVTAAGTAIGTPSYMAPEQARGEKRLTTAVDVYGLGGILFELLTGKPPFTGRTIGELLKKVTTEPPVAPRALNPSADVDLEAICLKCLEKDPRDRYPSAEAVAEDLERCARGEPVSVRRPSLSEWVRREVTKTPPPFPGYVWQVKVWFGAIIAASQTAVYAEAAAGVAVGWVWATLLAAWAGAAVALWLTMAAKFTRLPATEQNSVMIAVGHIAAHAALTVAYLPFTGPAAQVLGLYPAMAAVSGLAFFIVGATHWGRFYWIGLGVLALVPVTAALPEVAPLVFGWTAAAVMWHWAYAVKVTFAGPPP